MFVCVVAERDVMSVERSNMLSVLKLVVKQLIDSSLSQGCMLDDVQGPLLQFFIIIESMMCHGVKREIFLFLETSCYVCTVSYMLWPTCSVLSVMGLVKMSEHIIAHITER